jgi:predicted nucleic acid-binding protein
MKRAKVYLDVCSLNRPFDDQRQVRVHLEAEAVLMILEAVQDAKCELIASRVLDVENGRNPDEERRTEICNCLGLAGTYVDTEQSVLDRATQLEGFGFKPYDAMHLACAESAEADVFITTDDGIRKKAVQKGILNVKVVSPIDAQEYVSYENTK